MYILSQILMFFSVLFYVFSMLSKKKLTLVIYVFISNIFIIAHYFILGGLTGALTIIVDCFYLIIIYFLEKHKKETINLPITIIAMLLIIIITVFTWDSLISLLPMFSMLVYFLGMIFTNIIFVKTGSLACFILNTIYMILLKSYFGAIMEIFLIISAIVGIIIDVKHKNKNKNLETKKES